jgi:hybrid cluster-associated redox disulfide protein
MIINGETPINELIEQYPGVVEILLAYGLNCAGCHFSKHDTLESGVRLHGLDGDFELILKDVREIVEDEKRN